MFLPILFIVYIGSISFFTHAHIVNGVTIVHSHPFDSDTNHEHTTAEFQLIQHLNAVVVLPSVFAGIGIALFLIPLYLILFNKKQELYSLVTTGALFLRGPPVRINIFN